MQHLLSWPILIFAGMMASFCVISIALVIDERSHS